MFAESLLETSWAERGRRSWTTLTSFGLQAVVIGLLLLIPLLTTVGLPLARSVSTPISIGNRNPAPTPKMHGTRTSGVQIVAYAGPIMQPREIPHGIAAGKDQTVVATGPSIGPDVGQYIGEGPGLPIPIVGTHPVMPVISKLPEKIFRRSEILQGSLIRKVEPKYPQLAMAARIQGPVVLAAVISKTGTIENLKLVSGHPMLVPAAIDAVRQWQYRPYVLNGEVIEVETQITVNFTLTQ
jgi:periplasmic protein TonB